MSLTNSINAGFAALLQSIPIHSHPMWMQLYLTHIRFNLEHSSSSILSSSASLSTTESKSANLSRSASLSPSSFGLLPLPSPSISVLNRLLQLHQQFVPLVPSLTSKSTNTSLSPTQTFELPLIFHLDFILYKLLIQRQAALTWEANAALTFFLSLFRFSSITMLPASIQLGHNTDAFSHYSNSTHLIIMLSINNQLHFVDAAFDPHQPFALTLKLNQEQINPNVTNESDNFQYRIIEDEEQLYFYIQRTRRAESIMSAADVERLNQARIDAGEDPARQSDEDTMRWITQSRIMQADVFSDRITAAAADTIEAAPGSSTDGEDEGSNGDLQLGSRWPDSFLPNVKLYLDSIFPASNAPSLSDLERWNGLFGQICGKKVAARNEAERRRREQEASDSSSDKGFRAEDESGMMMQTMGEVMSGLEGGDEATAKDLKMLLSKL